MLQWKPETRCRFNENRYKQMQINENQCKFMHFQCFSGSPDLYANSMKINRNQRKTYEFQYKSMNINANYCIFNASVEVLNAMHFKYEMGFLGGWDYNQSEHSRHEIAWSSHFDPKP